MNFVIIPVGPRASNLVKNKFSSTRGIILGAMVSSEIFRGKVVVLGENLSIPRGETTAHLPMLAVQHLSSFPEENK
jgi:hypothetical protein